MEAAVEVEGAGHPNSEYCMVGTLTSIFKSYSHDITLHVIHCHARMTYNFTIHLLICI